MAEPMDDEAWAAALRSRSAELAPAVPVDVPLALRRGRRRRTVRGVAVGGGALAAACGVVVVVAAAVPSLLGGLGSPDQADSGGMAAGAADSASSASPGAGAGVTVTMTAPELAAALADGSVDDSTGRVVVEQKGVPSVEAFLTDIGADPVDDLADRMTVPAATWPGLMTDCLDRAGWAPTTTPRGWSVEVDAASAEAYLDDLATCVRFHPVG